MVVARTSRCRRLRYDLDMPWFLTNLWVLVWIATRWDTPALVEFVIAFGFFVLLIQMWEVPERRRSNIRRTTSAWFALWIGVTSVGVVASITDDHATERKK